jgi:hypothetical protein
VTTEAQRHWGQTEDPRLRNLYRAQEDRARRLELAIRDRKVATLQADDVRFIRNFAIVPKSIARMAMIRIWEMEAVNGS